jgi:hypothetical protein
MSTFHHVERLDSLDAFRGFTSQPAKPRLLVCHFGPIESISPAVRSAIAAVDEAIAKHLINEQSSAKDSSASSGKTTPSEFLEPTRATLVEAAHWNISPFPTAQSLLGIAPLSAGTSSPTPQHHSAGGVLSRCDAALIVMLDDAVADTFIGAATILKSVDDMAQRMKRYLTPGATSVKHSNDSSLSPSQIVEGGALQVDVAKMLAMGKSLMAKGQAMYAEKFFLKALGVLDAVGEDALLQQKLSAEIDFLLSLADCLAWVLMAQLVQGKNIEQNPAADRLEAEHGPLVAITPYPTNGDVQRALSARTLFRYAPAAWSPEACSVKILSALLTATPTDHKSRSLLVITLFLSNDVERCLTEALKLQVLGHDFGAIALSAVTAFLGADHELVQRLGWKP